MKRLLVLVGMICIMFSVPVFAEEEPETFTSGDFKYILLEDGTAEITQYKGEATDLEVPGELDGYAVTIIGDGAFVGCESLNSITLPEGLTSIGNGAFYNCESLSSITLADSIEMMGTNPFAYDLVSFTISPDHPYLAVIDGVLFSKPDKRLIYFPNTKKDYIVPNGIQIIGKDAFSGCENLSSIMLPESLTGIGASAFYDCYSLSSITLSEGLMSIGDAAFYDCYRLSCITLPEGLTSIGKSAFYNCKGLNSITLPEGLTSIGNGAFSMCDSLSSITVARDTYAAEYCKENGLNYTYPDANDWLNTPS